MRFAESSVLRQRRGKTVQVQNAFHLQKLKNMSKTKSLKKSEGYIFAWPALRANVKQSLCYTEYLSRNVNT